MKVARTTEQIVLEVMILQVGNRMRHIGFAGQERLFPDRLAAAQDARGPTNVRRQLADQDFGTEGSVAQLGMGEEEIVHPLRHMVGEFVGEGEADAQRLRRMDLFKSPGIAETLDWAEALVALDRVALDPQTVADTMGVLLKYQDDVAAIAPDVAAKLVAEVQAQGAGP